MLGTDFDDLKGRWVHVAAVFCNEAQDESDYQLYINGESQSLTSGATGTRNTDRSVSSMLTLGDESGNEFGGLLDDVQAYNRELRADEVMALLDAEKSVYWKYDALGRKIEEAQSLVVTADGVATRPTTRYRYDEYGNLAGVSGTRASAGDFNTDDSLADALVAHWKLDESDGTSVANEVADSPAGILKSGSTDDGLAISDARFNNGLLSNGSHAWVDNYDDSDPENPVVLSIPNLNDTEGEHNTVAFWMKWDGDSNGDMPFRWLTGGAAFDLVLLSGGRISFNTGQGDYLETANGTIVANEWIHIAAAFINGAPDETGGVSNCSIWVNGVEMQLTQTGNSPISHIASGSTRVEFGGRSYSGNQYNGLLDDLQIYNRKLTLEEVAALFDRQWTTQYEYDKRGRATNVQDAEGGLAEAQYDAAGNTVASIDALGSLTRFEYDSQNRQTKQILRACTNFCVRCRLERN